MSSKSLSIKKKISKPKKIKSQCQCKIKKLMKEKRTLLGEVKKRYDALYSDTKTPSLRQLSTKFLAYWMYSNLNYHCPYDLQYSNSCGRSVFEDIYHTLIQNPIYGDQLFKYTSVVEGKDELMVDYGLPSKKHARSLYQAIQKQMKTNINK